MACMLLIKGCISCRWTEVSTYMKAGIQGTTWSFAHQALEPGPPPHPQAAISWATDRSAPCLPRIWHPLAALLVLFSISAAELCFAAGIRSVLPSSTAPPCLHSGHTAAHDKHHSSCQWPGVYNSADSVPLQHALRSLEAADYVQLACWPWLR